MWYIIAHVWNLFCIIVFYVPLPLFSKLILYNSFYGKNVHIKIHSSELQGKVK